MLDLTEIKRRLEDRNKVLVAKRTGLCVQTIHRIMKGTTVPTYETVKILGEYLEKH